MSWGSGARRASRGMRERLTATGTLVALLPAGAVPAVLAARTAGDAGLLAATVVLLGLGGLALSARLGRGRTAGGGRPTCADARDGLHSAPWHGPHDCC